MYKDIGKEIEEVIRPFYEKGETVKYIRVSYKDKLYKEIQFRKKGFGKNYYILRGILFLTEENEIIKDSVLLEELEKLAYYYKIIFNEENKNSLVSNFEEENSILRFEDDSNRALKALDFLKYDKMDAILKLKEIITKIVALRKEKNNKIKQLMSLNDKIKENNFVFTEDVFSNAYNVFEDILRINFQGVKLINSWRIHYDDLNQILKKQKRGFAIKLNRDLYVGFLRLEYILSYFKKVLNTYDAILNFDQNSYMKYIRSKHRENIKENLKGIRK